MKYTKDFEKHWKNAKGAAFGNLEQWHYEEIKRVAFRAWKAGQRDVKYKYGLRW